ncbi:MAG: hypothetical protein RLN62_06935 [Rickettsiales bacterium]
MFKKLSKLSILAFFVSTFIFIEAFAVDLGVSRANYNKYKQQAPKVNRILSDQAVAKYAKHSRNMAPTVRRHIEIRDSKRANIARLNAEKIRKEALMSDRSKSSTKDYSHVYKLRAQKLDKTYNAANKRFDNAAKEIIERISTEESTIQAQVDTLTGELADMSADGEGGGGL